MTRYDQANSLLVADKVLRADLDLSNEELDYRDAVEKITGITPALIPTEEFMKEYRGRILDLMGKPRDSSLANAAAEWRKDIGILSKEDMGVVYRNAAQLMLHILKKHGMPEEAELKVDILKEAPFMGFFAYGHPDGHVYGETCMVESDKKCPFDVIHTATHEVGGHYFVHAKWHEYAKQTGDLFGAVGAMATSEAVTNEGYANCAAETFGSDLAYLFEKIGFGLDKMGEPELAKHLEISGNLERLAMMALGYEAARYFHLKNVTPEEMRTEYIEFGIDPDRTKIRVKKMTGPDAKKLHAFCYEGPAYYPGMAVVEKIEKHGSQRVIDSICPKGGPPSLRMLNVFGS